MSEFWNKIIQVQSEIGALQKDNKVSFGNTKYSYFDINQLIEKLQPLLAKNGLVLIQPIKEGKVYSIITDGNDTIESAMTLPELSDPQKMGSAVTYYRRYTLQSLLALQAEDDDGQAATKQAQEDSRPWLSEKQFEQAKERIQGGAKGVLANASKHFRMKREYRTELQELENRNK